MIPTRKYRKDNTDIVTDTARLMLRFHKRPIVTVDRRNNVLTIDTQGKPTSVLMQKLEGFFKVFNINVSLARKSGAIHCIRGDTCQTLEPTARFTLTDSEMACLRI